MNALHLNKMEQKPLRTTITLPLDISEKIEKHYRIKLKESADTKDISDIPTLSSILIDLIQKGWYQIENKNIIMENIVDAGVIKAKKYVFRITYHPPKKEYFTETRQNWFDILHIITERKIKIMRVAEWEITQKNSEIKTKLVENKKHGEEIRYIHNKDIPEELRKSNSEFWLIDDSNLIITKYNPQGILDDFEQTYDKTIIEKYIEYKNQILEKSSERLT